MYPPTCAPTNCSTYDYIVVGAGSAGSVLANRLTEAGHLVLLLEAGGYPALESQDAKAMTDVAATVLSSMGRVQQCFNVIQGLSLLAWKYPPTCTPTSGSYVDYIVIGCGSSGSVIASRLSENSSVTVQVFEAGGVPPLESSMPGTFPLLPNSPYDYNLTAVNDGYAAQNLQGNSVRLTQGKMLGGSGSIDHMIHVQPTINDLFEWVNKTNDTNWNYTNMLPYLKMQEKCEDAEIMNSSYAANHGTMGPKIIISQTSANNAPYLNAFEELGHKINIDSSDGCQLGAQEPLFNIKNERISNGLSYLALTKNRTNICISMSFTVTKILIKNGTAYGVVAVDSSGNTYEVYAKKEVILSAGAINSPKLLQLSGIGNSTYLKSLGIKTVINLPDVGKNLQDHASALLGYQMAESTSAARPTNPNKFPVDTHTLYAAGDSSQTYPDYQVIGLLFQQSSQSMVQLLANGLQYTNNVSNIFYKASEGRDMYLAILNIMKPKSRGSVLVKSDSYKEDPIVNLGLLSNGSDLSLLAQSLKDFNKVLNTTYFKSVNASLVDVGLCSDTTGIDFWKCYAAAMSNTMWHYSGTCAMGSVLDSELKVKGISGLRVIDSSAMPTIPSGNILATVTMLAEKGADIIKS